MITVSAVITAPRGIKSCVYLDDLIAQADACRLEIVVVDGSDDYVDYSRPNLRHISKPGASIQGLITQGLVQATGEWVLVTEHHARPLPGLLAAYSEAVEANPGIDLFSGEVENLTSISPWAFANFLISLGDFWPSAHSQPSTASNANLLVRRCAILPSELALEGGFLYLTIARLVAAGRHGHCAGAVVDHVLPLTFSEAVAFQYHCVATGTAARRCTSPLRPLPVQALRDGLALVYFSVVTPYRVMSTLYGTSQFRVHMALRMALLGLASSAGLLSADFKGFLGGWRTGSRLEAPPTAST